MLLSAFSGDVVGLCLCGVGESGVGGEVVVKDGVVASLSVLGGCCGCFSLLVVGVATVVVVMVPGAVLYW